MTSTPKSTIPDRSQQAGHLRGADVNKANVHSTQQAVSTTAPNHPSQTNPS
jgi:hypothetical protein